MQTAKFLVVPKFRLKAVRCVSFSSIFSPRKKEDPQPTGYSIEIVKEADLKPTLTFIQKNYFVEEPLSKSLNLTRRSFEGCIEVFVLDAMRQHGLTLIAKAHNNDKDDIIGACINIKSCSFDAVKFNELAKCATSSKAKKLFHLWSLLSSGLYGNLKDHCIFEVKMLAVNKCYQGQGLATELLQKSLQLARDSNFTYAAITCTNEYGRRMAENQKMKLLWEVPFKNILLSDEKTPVFNPQTPHLSASVSYVNLKE